MENGILQYLIICPLLFLAGFVDSIAGGGGLISLPAYLIAGLGAHSAVATNKLSSTIGTSIATARYIKEGYVKWKIAVICAAAAMAGSSIGSSINLLIDDSVLKTVMLFLLPVTAFVVFRTKGFESEAQKETDAKTYLIASVIALVIGAYDGFYGPGTGTFLLLCLTLLAGLGLKDANGITKIINLSSNVAAAVIFLINGKTIIVLGLIAGIFNALGNYFGSKLFVKDGARIVKPIMLSVLAVFFIKVLFELTA